MNTEVMVTQMAELGLPLPLAQCPACHQPSDLTFHKVSDDFVCNRV